MESQLLDARELRLTRDGSGAPGRVGVIYMDRASGALYRWSPVEGVMKPASGDGLNLQSTIEDGQYLKPEAPVSPGAPAIHIAAHEYDASRYGFKAGPLTHPTPESELIAAAPDSSTAMLALEDEILNWKSAQVRPLTVRFTPGYYKFDSIKHRERASSEFYQRQGLILEGYSSHATFFCASTSAEPEFYGLAGNVNWVGAPTLRRVTLVGAGAANPYQVGVFLNPLYIPDIGFGGVTNTEWWDVQIRGFAREQLWLRGGSEDFLVPVQYGAWRAIRCFALSKDYAAAKFTGQIGPPWDMEFFEAYGTDEAGSVACFVGLDTRTGLALSSVSTATNSLTFAEPHRFKIGDRLRLTGGTAWGGLDVDTDYFAYPFSDFAIRVCASKANAYAATPVFLTMTSSTGTATVASRQVNGAQIAAQQLNFRSPTFQLAEIGLDVQGSSLVSITDQHTEETGTAIRAGVNSIVRVDGGIFQNAGKPLGGGGTVFDDSAGGAILIGEGCKVVGTHTKLVSGGATNIVRSTLPPGGIVGTYSPTAGVGVTGKGFNYTQIGNAAEIDLGQSRHSEFILNSGSTVITHIRGQHIGTCFFVVLDVGVDWVEFSAAGNINLVGKDFNGNTMRVPAGAALGFREVSLGEKFVLTTLNLPTHADSWTVTGDIAAGASITKVIACPGARVGDMRPDANVNVVLTAGLILTAEVTTTDAVTVRITNPTTGALAGPTNPAVYVRQVR